MTGGLQTGGLQTRSAPSPRAALAWSGLSVLCIGAATAASLRPALAGTWFTWAGLAVPYALLSVLAVRRLGQMHALRGLLRFKAGDPTLGAGIGLALILGAWLVQKLLFGPTAPERAWLVWIFAQLGDGLRPATALALVLVVLGEELVWRGWIQTELRRAWGARRAWPIGALAYALAHLGTLFTLRDANAGLNPLLVLGALGCGLCWGWVVERTGRLLPSAMAHLVFTYFGADYLRPY